MCELTGACPETDLTSYQVIHTVEGDTEDKHDDHYAEQETNVDIDVPDHSLGIEDRERLGHPRKYFSAKMKTFIW